MSFYLSIGALIGSALIRTRGDIIQGGNEDDIWQNIRFEILVCYDIPFSQSPVNQTPAGKDESLGHAPCKQSADSIDISNGFLISILKGLISQSYPDKTSCPYSKHNSSENLLNWGNSILRCEFT